MEMHFSFMIFWSVTSMEQLVYLIDCSLLSAAVDHTWANESYFLFLIKIIFLYLLVY